MPKGRPKKNKILGGKSPQQYAEDVANIGSSPNSEEMHHSSNDLFTKSFAGFGSPEELLPDSDVANMKFISRLPQFISFRRWFVMNARDHYRRAGISDIAENAKLNANVGRVIEDMLFQLDSLSTLAEPVDQKDAYDGAQNESQAYQDNDIITQAPR